MVLTRRVKHLERDRIVNCPVCRGQGRVVFETVNSPFRDADDEPIDKSGCPRCGRVKLITVRYERESPNKVWT